MVLKNLSQPQIQVGCSQEGMSFLLGVIPKKPRGFCSIFLAEHMGSSAAASLMHTSHRGGFKPVKRREKVTSCIFKPNFTPPQPPRHLQRRPDSFFTGRKPTAQSAGPARSDTPPGVSFVLTFSGDKREQRWAAVKTATCAPQASVRGEKNKKITICS